MRAVTWHFKVAGREVLAGRCPLRGGQNLRTVHIGIQALSALLALSATLQQPISILLQCAGLTRGCLQVVVHSGAHTGGLKLTFGHTEQSTHFCHKAISTTCCRAYRIY